MKTFGYWQRATYMVRRTTAFLSTMVTALTCVCAAVPASQAHAIVPSVITVTSSESPSYKGDKVTFTVTVQQNSGVPTGTVIFRDGVRELNPLNEDIPLTDGKASLQVSGLVVGTHSITAQYSGDGNYSNGFSPVLIQTVNPARTQTGTVLTSSISSNVSVFGEQITYTATVSANSGTPTGTVTFMDGATELGKGTLAAGNVLFSTSTLAVGNHTIVALYGGDADFSVSASNPLPLTVTKAGTTVYLSSTPNPSTPGQTVLFTAAVNTSFANVRSQITGEIDFYDGTAKVYSAPYSNGGATYQTSSLTPGDHKMKAIYVGDANFTANTSNVQDQTVALPFPIVTLSLSPNPSTFGQQVTLTATVSALPGTSGTPTGNVTFQEGTTALGSGTLAAGKATFSTSTLSAGSHTIIAAYAGDTDFSGKNSTPLTQNVDKAATTVALSSTPNPSTPGQTVFFTAAVNTGYGNVRSQITGEIDFYDGMTKVYSTPYSNGGATYQTSSLAPGDHKMKAIYVGDANFTGNTSNVQDQTVGLASPAVTLSLSPNPSTFGQQVTFTATVSALTGMQGTPTGNVTFQEGTTALGTGTLAAGKATFSTSTLSVGGHTIIAAYAGDADFSGKNSAPMTQNVGKAAANVTLTSTPNPSSPGQQVTFTATVSALAGMSGTPTGNVSFQEGTTVLGTGTLAASNATFSTSSLSAGSHSITAAYAGDADFTAKTSTALNQQVSGKITPKVILTVSPNPAQVGNTVTFTATVQQAPGYPVPDGSITISSSTNGDERYGSANLNVQGIAIITNSNIPAGTYTVVATYGGDNAGQYYNGAQSNTVNLTVNPPAAGSSSEGP